MFFEYPKLLWLLLLLIPLLAWYLWRELKGRRATLTVSSGQQWKGKGSSRLVWMLFKLLTDIVEGNM